MENFKSRAVFLVTLGLVFIVTLAYSYGPGYGGSLMANIKAGKTDNATISNTMSPKAEPTSRVTSNVTPKVMVTSPRVTNVTSMSPYIQGDMSNNGDSLSVTGTPSVSPTPVVTYSTPPPTLSPSSLIPPSPIAQTMSPRADAAVVINEIAWMGTAFSANDEWIELYNTEDFAVDLSGWTLNSTTGASPDPKISLSGVISAKGYAVLERTDDSTVSNLAAFKVYSGALNDAGETLELRNNEGDLIDSVPKTAIGWYSGNKATRSTMERVNPHLPGHQALNWATFEGYSSTGNDARVPSNSINGTPGSVNRAAKF
ncbi:MAG: Polymorphic membrane protein [Candidatus Nomurabacteria bacterium GW2011_GWA1_46_11]|uniref:Polymorphic membrane protein n=2 Tax=Parcubacteria group TaxID=1794811 RepID=A0A0G1NQ83_9BACT|nr:MAG: Polymorphic membrane protein [Candidatus Nomurabacteria bacterium GW2011_GWA1_46_11]